MNKELINSLNENYNEVNKLLTFDIIINDIMIYSKAGIDGKSFPKKMINDKLKQELSNEGFFILYNTIFDEYVIYFNEENYNKDLNLIKSNNDINHNDEYDNDDNEYVNYNKEKVYIIDPGVLIFILFLIGLICGLIFGEHNIFYPLFAFLIISFAVSYANNKNN
jgi:hypothetical protein